MYDNDFENQKGQGMENGLPSAQSYSSMKNQGLTAKQDQFDPLNCGLTIAFKIIAITLYLILKLLTDSYLGTFITTVLLVSIDFWVTKNLTGRKLVGLIWSSRMKDDGEQQWIFQARNPNHKANSKNSVIFWISQLISILFWGIILIINIFTISLFWIGLAVYSLLLTCINFVCFFKCRGGHQKTAENIGQKLGIKMKYSIS